jgi:hypothetical protein
MVHDAPTTGGGWTWTSQRCGRYKYQKLLVDTTNPDHLVPSTPSLTDVPRLQVVPRYRGTMGVGGRDLNHQLAIAS